ncbi:somatomedin-B and thrombospondin type-1 domain-containing protein-like [Uloborus diversus]|uniref:somatomedin-B and thrombospondin type-1 domain-containing protein-like n=1 Tax=Uloborus diversus TaxID=327109 RepID=UPI0024099C2E|nr:somatomedin-B and thrombospondin type-1 domain-containing protein-like [Uloborus diversus]
MSGWGPWSTCNSDCGAGTMVRERKILRLPRNGGTPCPDQMQTRGCFGSSCDTKSIAKAKREMALILPGKFSHARVTNSSTDIRKNLRLKYPKNPAKDGSKEYCVTFEVNKIRKACESIVRDDVSILLVKGARLRIGCEDAAMRGHLGYRCNGHGVDGKPTRFTFVSDPRCHGRWTRVDTAEQCTGGKPDFIFV